MEGEAPPPASHLRRQRCRWTEESRTPACQHQAARHHQLVERDGGGECGEGDDAAGAAGAAAAAGGGGGGGGELGHRWLRLCSVVVLPS